MARKTKAEREYEAMMEKARRDKEAFDSYPTRMMEVLTNATAETFEVKVVNFQFVVRDYDDARSRRFVFDNYWTEENAETLRELALDVEDKRSDRLEAEERMAKKAAALAKLTKEERELLNLA
jgi:hypothetical protein